MFMADSPKQPTKAEVSAWLGDVTPAYIHDELWPEANTACHGITAALRRFANDNYPPEIRGAFLDGVAAAINATLIPFNTRQLEEMFGAENPAA